ncbi:hypothetical protein [Corallococcus sp. EGB]|uniref:hypothetical protein n=1 Tax=Corallococcus sp. EGB TaxID=1521117 RepID=UPI001CC1ACF8|nr:hypothetical protein [Corallococcus sp. EGB]
MLRIAALPTDLERQWALDALSEKNMGEWLDVSGGVGNILSWRRDPTVYCTERRENDAEIEEAESVHFRVRPRPSSPDEKK